MKFFLLTEICCNSVKVAGISSSKNGMYTKTPNAIGGKDIYQKDGASSGSYMFFHSGWGGWIFGDDTSSSSTGVLGQEVRDKI